LQAALEIAGIDGANEDIDHSREGLGLARGQRPAGDGGGDRVHRRREVGGALNRRQHEVDGALAARPEDSFEDQSERGRVAAIGKLDGAPGQPLGLAVEQRLGGEARLVARPRQAPFRIPRLPFSKRPPARFCSGIGHSPSRVAKGRCTSHDYGDFIVAIIDINQTRDRCLKAAPGGCSCHNQ